MCIITPKRKNQHTKNTKKQQNLLKFRYLIENFFSDIKKNIRIMVRKEKHIINYLSFMYIAMLEITDEGSFDHSSVITSNTSERSKDPSSVLAEFYIKYAIANGLTKYII